MLPLADETFSAAKELEQPDPVPPGNRRFRSDIQGLRAIAVLFVVLYHAKTPGVRGGYIGVDVFFVISGFLITGQLVREVVKSGRIFFADFYLKRIRRLLPPAAIVVIATLAVSWFWATPLQTRSLGIDAAFTAFYGLNYRLAIQGINYQNETAPPSPLQHFWSLAVEEQYYVLWPVIIMIIVLLARHWWKYALPVVLIAAIAGSLYMSQALLRNDQPLSYFSIQSRAWELGVGAVAALMADSLRELPRTVRVAASWGGLALVLGCGFYYTDNTSFPGYNAVPPVLGTAMIIAAGCGGPVGAETLLKRRPMQGLGKLSYTWYLWHWPVLLLAPLLAPGTTFDWIINLEMMVVALWFAALTYYLLEYPLKRLPFHKVRWLGAGILTSAATAAAGVGVSVIAVAALNVSSVPVQLASSGNPFVSHATSGAVTPSVLDAGTDTPHYPADCILDLTLTVQPRCVIGPKGKATTAPMTSNRVVLLGDSHAGQWFAPVHAFAAANAWSVEVLNKDGCPLASISVVNSALARPYTECNVWRSAMLSRLLHEPRPKIIFISSLNSYTNHASTLDNGWAVTLKALKRLGSKIVYLADTPHPPINVPSCVSGALQDWTKCDFLRSPSLRRDPLLRGPLRRYLSAVVDINDYLCPGTGTKCPSVLAGVLLYRDASHVTNAAMSALTGVVEAQLKKAGLEPRRTEITSQSHRAVSSG
jgi:peptidoglycan/LPS O-acetylase OafA/YrhL